MTMSPPVKVGETQGANIIAGAGANETAFHTTRQNAEHFVEHRETELRNAPHITRGEKK